MAFDASELKRVCEDSVSTNFYSHNTKSGQRMIHVKRADILALIAERDALLTACQSVDIDFSEHGVVRVDTVEFVRAALDEPQTIAEKSLALVEKMRKTLDDAKVGPV